MSTTNEALWREYGLAAEACAQADSAMAEMVKAVELAGPVAERVFSAALFQVRTLPTLSPEAQKRLAWVKP